MEGQLFPGMSDVSQHLVFLVYAPFSGRNHFSVPGSHGVSNPFLSERTSTGKLKTSS